MQFSYHCVECLLKMQLSRIRTQSDMAKKLACANECFEILANAPKDVSAPVIVPQLDDSYRKFFGGDVDPHIALKQRSGRIMLERLPDIRARVLAADDPLRAALLCSRAANYIDFSLIGDHIDTDYLDDLLLRSLSAALDETEYRNFKADLAKAESLLLLTDNAGEIVLDRLILEVLREQYPHVDLTVCVRGGPALNDALREDALEAGLDRYARLIDNGSRIGATEIPYLGKEAREALERASLILAKGQANLESMFGCGYNVYYLFLCKCPRFVQMFGVPSMSGMFLNDRRAALADPTA